MSRISNNKSLAFYEEPMEILCETPVGESLLIDGLSTDI